MSTTPSSPSSTVVVEALSEFLTSTDTAEAARRLREARCSGSALVLRSVAVTLSRGSQAGEALCSLITACVLHGIVRAADVEHGLLCAIARLGDYLLDFPASAPTIIADIASWLVVAGVVRETSLAPSPANAAAHAAARAEVGALAGGDTFAVIAALLVERPSHTLTFAQLRTMYKKLLDRFLESGGAGLDALTASLAEMQSRHTLCELVRKAAIACIEAEDVAARRPADEAAAAPSAAFVREICSDLVATLVKTAFTTQFDVATGVLASLAEARERALDTPGAERTLGRFIARSITDSALPSDFLSGTAAAESAGGVAAQAALDEARAVAAETTANVWAWPCSKTVAELRAAAAFAGSDFVGELFIATLKVPRSMASPVLVGVAPGESGEMPAIHLGARMEALAAEGAALDALETIYAERLAELRATPGVGDALHNEAVRALIESALHLEITAAGGGGKGPKGLQARVCALLSTLHQGGSLSKHSLRQGIARVIDTLFYEQSAGRPGSSAGDSFLGPLIGALELAGALSAPSLAASLPTLS